MKSNARITRGLRLALLLAASACGGETGKPAPMEPQPPAPVDPVVPREPLVTLEGTLTLNFSVPLDEPVRLALAWYQDMIHTDEANRLSRPLAIVEEGVVYQGLSPVNFHFRIDQPPPEEMMRPWGVRGVTTKAAVGALIAYKDMNGNGKLDTIPVTGTPIDRILGTSMEWWTEPETQKYMVAYIESALPELGLEKGFNLLELTRTNGAAPLSTPIPLYLSAGGPEFDALVCEGLWLVENPPPANQCGLGFNR